ncbi:hypothetical protein D4R71_03460 [bacterium]|nr:MAG: hypothetical protein D4R71_03460 [bacterium]
MTTAQKIKNKIDRTPAGTTFKYQQLDITPAEFNAAAKAIERLIAKAVIKRVSTGIFYKPRMTAFGELYPSEEELLKPYLFVQGKRIAYITGTALYNRMGLTSQIPKITKVACRNNRLAINNGVVRIKSVKSYVDITNDNYSLLQLLDVLKDFKFITDLKKESTIKILQDKFKELTDKDRVRLIKYALQYPPRTRSLLGALLSKIGCKENISRLMQSLNPFTVYDIGITKDDLSTAPEWNIT